MARKQDPVTRLADVRGDFEDALQNYMLKAGALCIAAETVLELAQTTLGDKFPKALSERLQSAIDAYRAS